MELVSLLLLLLLLLFSFLFVSKSLELLKRESIFPLYSCDKLPFPSFRSMVFSFNFQYFSVSQIIQELCSSYSFHFHHLSLKPSSRTQFLLRVLFYGGYCLEASSSPITSSLVTFSDHIIFSMLPSTIF